MNTRRICLCFAALSILLAACAAPAPQTSAHPPVMEAAATAAPVSSAGREAAPVTAGVVDDNTDWRAYLAYRSRHTDLSVKDRDISERYRVNVIDASEQPVPDALVQIWANGELFFTGRTDAGGQLLFHPRAIAPQLETGQFTIRASKGEAAQEATFARFSETPWTLSLTGAPHAGRAQLDLLFMIDATGSMGDEISQLKSNMGVIAARLAALPQQPNIRYSLEAYRDRGDEFVKRAYDFTPDLEAFQRNLAALQADGGGDEPESVNEALDYGVNHLSWRTDDTVRIILLVGDAPPHLDYGENATYDVSMLAAAQRGIKIFPIGASGLNPQGEYIFRQLAQFTGGKFVFLTYAQGGNSSSGPGTTTTHDVTNYSVDMLDQLVVRLVQDELARLPQTADKSGQD